MPDNELRRAADSGALLKPEVLRAQFRRMIASARSNAVAEKVAKLRTDNFFRERAGRSDVAKAKRILRRVGQGKPPALGDEAG